MIESADPGKQTSNNMVPNIVNLLAAAWSGRRGGYAVSCCDETMVSPLMSTGLPQLCAAEAERTWGWRWPRAGTWVKRFALD